MEDLISKETFSSQLLALVKDHGPAAFAAEFGSLPELTVFVDDHKVVAEDATSPRHRYGLFFEQPGPLTESALATAVHDWITSGKAYEQHISMNICRYNC